MQSDSWVNRYGIWHILIREDDKDKKMLKIIKKINITDGQKTKRRHGAAVFDDDRLGRA